jgi:hypothetical protein
MAKKSRRDRKAAAARSSATAPASIPNIPRWLPPTLFIGLTLLLFRVFVFSDQMLVGNDTLGLGYVARAFYAQAMTQMGIFPRWSPMILGGTPFLEALSGGDSLYPPSLVLLLVMAPYRALGWKLVIHIAAAGFFMFGWIRSIRGSRPAALLAAVGYMLAPFLVSLVHPGHDGKIFVTALAPLLFWAVERHFVRPRLATFTAIALVVALVIYTTHFQMAYFLFGAVGLYAIFRSVQLWRGGGAEVADGASHAGLRPAGLRFALFLSAAVVGLGIAAVQFVPAAAYVTEYSRRVQTTREAAGETSAAWSSSWSLHPEETMSLIIPEFVGSNARGPAWTRDTYWGRNVFKYNHEYVGLVLLLLAAVSFVGGARSGLRWFFTGLGAVALLFALGTTTPVWRVFYELVPGVRLFRAPSQVIFLFGFGAATLAALGLDRVLEVAGEEDDDAWGKIMRLLWVATAGLGLLALLAGSGVLTSLWTSTVYRGIPPERLEALETLRPFITRGAFVAFFLALATSGTIWALRARYLAPAGLVAALVLFVAVDQIRISSAFIQVMDFDQWAAPGPNIQAVLQREAGSDEPYRLLSFRQSGQDVMPALYGIELAAGHHPNDLSRYRELIGMVGSSDPVNMWNSNIRRLLNVKYLLWPDYRTGQSLNGPVVSRTQLQDGRAYETVYAVNGLARARLVGAAVVKSDAEAVPYMLSAAFDPEREVVLAEASPIALDGDPVQGSVSWLERTPNTLRLSVTSDRPALLTIADNWFPAWHATVDGEEAPVLRAYHTLRAVPVPAGEHTVEMTYRSSLVTRSLWVSLVLFFGLVGATGVQMWRERRTREAT